MVDFNNEATMGKPPKEVVALIIIEKVYNFLEADEDYAKNKLRGGQVSYAIAQARLRNLFFVSHTLLKRGLKEKEFDEITQVCLNTDSALVEHDDVLECFGRIFEVLDKVGLWKIDTKPTFNRLSVEESNQAQGLG
jgi:hypothetical protein